MALTALRGLLSLRDARRTGRGGELATVGTRGGRRSEGRVSADGHRTGQRVHTAKRRGCPVPGWDRAAGGQMNATATIAPAPQHMQALQRANKVRLARAELKRRIAAGEISAGEVILTCPWEADSMSVADLLMSQRRWGHTRCRNFLAGVPM